MFFLLLCLSLHSQSIEQIKTQKEIAPLLCHEWNFTYNTALDSFFVKESFPSEKAEILSVKFLPDGSVIIKDADTAKGSWNYNATNRNLLLEIENKTVKLKILKLTKKELVVENNNKGRLKRTYLKRPV
jgi:hypothetical protein